MERAIPHLPGDDLTVAKDFYIDELGFTLRFEATEDGRTGLVGVERGGMCLTIDCPMPGHGRDVCVLGQKFADAARATLAVYEGLPPGAPHGLRGPDGARDPRAVTWEHRYRVSPNNPVDGLCVRARGRRRPRV